MKFQIQMNNLKVIVAKCKIKGYENKSKLVKEFYKEIFNQYSRIKN